MVSVRSATVHQHRAPRRYRVIGSVYVHACLFRDVGKRLAAAKPPAITIPCSIRSETAREAFVYCCFYSVDDGLNGS